MSSRQYAVFTINGEEFGLEIEKISIIERMLAIFKIPNAPDYIEGLANLRGKVHTIFNLRKRFHLPCPEFNEDTKVIIAKAEDSVVGLIVDGVRQIVRVEDNQFEPAPKALVTVKDKFLSGTAKIGDRLILILDLEKVISEEDVTDLPSVKAEKTKSTEMDGKPGKKAKTVKSDKKTKQAKSKKGSKKKASKASEEPADRAENFGTAKQAGAESSDTTGNKA